MGVVRVLVILDDTAQLCGEVVAASLCLHTASMPNVLVRGIPDDVHTTLQRRAQRQGQSLQQYLAAELTRLASQPSLEELFDRVRRRSGGSVGLQTAVDDLGAERGDR
jgi:plasmid stability protein